MSGFDQSVYTEDGRDPWQEKDREGPKSTEPREMSKTEWVVGQVMPLFVSAAQSVWKFEATVSAATDIADQLALAIADLRRQNLASLKLQFLKVGEGVWLAYAE